MKEDVKKFLDAIKYPTQREELININILKVILIKNKNIMDVHLENKEVLPYNIVNKLWACCNEAKNDIYSFNLHFHYLEIKEEDVLKYLQELLNI